MADFSTIIWAALIISIVMAGIWVFFSIRKTLTSTLVFDLFFTLLLIVELMNTVAIQGDFFNNPQYLITFITFFLNLAMISVILIEWRDSERSINQYVLWFKFALSIIGVYTCIPLGLYYLRLYYLPEHENQKKNELDSAIPVPAEFSCPREITLPPPELLNRYSGWTYIGKGGFARVFRVRKKDGTEVALKVPLVLDQETGKTFIAEIQNWTHLKQENIVRVLEYNIIPIPFFEMELCDSSLAEEKKPLMAWEAALIVFDICEGLKYSHEKGIIHRDLKSSNILIKDGIVKITDWGLSTVLAKSNISTSQVVFTPGFAAPEQILGNAKGTWTDIWQTGVIFYELVTGEMPFKGGNFIELLADITTNEPVLPSMRSDELQPLDGIIMQCLRKSPEERYQDILHLQDDTARYLIRVLNDRSALSISQDDLDSAAIFCSELLLISLKMKDYAGAYRYGSELMNYAKRAEKSAIGELEKKIQVHLKDESVSDPAELVEMARKLRARLRDTAMRDN
jgi:eukaryotic-like serine/threonine-protein kinase